MFEEPDESYWASVAPSYKKRYDEIKPIADGLLTEVTEEFEGNTEYLVLAKSFVDAYMDGKPIILSDESRQRHLAYHQIREGFRINTSFSYGSSFIGTVLQGAISTRRFGIDLDPGFRELGFGTANRMILGKALEDLLKELPGENPDQYYDAVAMAPARVIDRFLGRIQAPKTPLQHWSRAVILNNTSLEEKDGLMVGNLSTGIPGLNVEYRYTSDQVGTLLGRTLMFNPLAA